MALSSLKSLMEKGRPLPQLWEMPDFPEEHAGASHGIRGKAA